VRRWGSRFVRLLAVFALAFAIFQLIGPERVWTLFGPADLGPVSFETLQRRETPNDALACPPNLCQAKADVVSPAFAVTARDLRLAFARAIADEPRLLKVNSDDASMTERYIQRSRLMRYPDTIVVRFIDLPGSHSTLALYSRSQLGKGDLGVNLARINRWLAALEALAPALTSP
jgi:uncharacterized protein (DUF1499 family)